MKEEKFDIKEGIKLHLIKTDLFKTNLSCVLITVPLKREKVTSNALIPFLLRRGTAKLKDQYEINKKLENLYGSNFDCGIDKSGDNQVIKFYMDGINDKFLLSKEDLLKQNLELLFDIVFNPYLENGLFKSEFLEMEKNNLENVINGKIDDKDFYAFNDCLEKMYGKEGFGLYKYGYLEDLENITLESISAEYKELISKSKIDIFVSGEFEVEEVKNIILNNENILKLEARKPDYIKMNPIEEVKTKIENVAEYKEQLNVNQGKLILGLDVNYNNSDYKYVALIYNAILGESANSKLFQNVREKAQLAYVASSSYLRYKSNIFIKCGIEIENFEKAVKIIKQQLEDMKNGNFSEEDIENGKKGIIAGIRTIDDEQDTQITYYFGQELSNKPVDIEEYKEKIQSVTKDDIVEIAKKININTIYFLRN